MKFLATLNLLVLTACIPDAVIAQHTMLKYAWMPVIPSDETPADYDLLEFGDDGFLYYFDFLGNQVNVESYEIVSLNQICLSDNRLVYVKFLKDFEFEWHTTYIKFDAFWLEERFRYPIRHVAVRPTRFDVGDDTFERIMKSSKWRAVKGFRKADIEITEADEDRLRYLAEVGRSQTLDVRHPESYHMIMINNCLMIIFIRNQQLLGLALVEELTDKYMWVNGFPGSSKSVKFKRLD